MKEIRNQGLSVVLGFSGRLGSEVVSQIIQSNEVTVVGLMLDSSTDQIFDYEGLDLPCFVGNPRKSEFEIWWKTLIKRADFIFTVNYLFLLDKPALSLPDRGALNIHGSLLPLYRGRTPHVWAIINGEKHSGITVHIIDEGCDTGDIVLQRRIEITAEMTGNDLLQIFKGEYPDLVLESLSLVVNPCFSAKLQDDSKAIIFPKRTPDDGGINWNWSSERIANWVRAQALPYPGAFTVHAGERIIIDKCRIVDDDLLSIVKCGEVISLEPFIVVGTGSGAVELIEVRKGAPDLSVGLILTHD